MTLAPTHASTGRASRRTTAALVVVIAILAVTVLALLVRYEVFDRSSTSSSVHGSGVAAVQNRDLPPFTGVELSGSNEVHITVGGPQAVVVSADDNLIDGVTTTVVAGQLVVGNRPGSFTTETPMRVDVTVPSLDGLALPGSGVVSVTGIRAQSLTVSLSGSGALHATGVAEQLSVELGGTGDAELQGLVAGDVSAVLNGTGRIVVTATSSIDASVPGTGTIVYGGNPSKVTRSVTGTGAIVAD